MQLRNYQRAWSWNWFGKINQNKSLLGLLKWLEPLRSGQTRTRETFGVRFNGNIWAAISGPTTFHKITSCRKQHLRLRGTRVGVKRTILVRQQQNTGRQRPMLYVPHRTVQLKVMLDESRFIFFRTCAESESATRGMLANTNTNTNSATTGRGWLIEWHSQPTTPD